ncbi:MAG: quinone oxidoreductase [Chloroflexi bacterium]|nr:quinone oxidoreductase [Chloroflexota bacterium]
MKSIRVHEFGGIDALKLEEIAKPEPGKGEARVRIQAIGVNFIDVYQRVGLYKPALPFTLGQEAAGVVDAVGAGVTEVKAGDRVAYTSVLGSYAEYANVPAWRLFPVPDDVTPEQAAGVALQGLTAHYLACSTFPIKPGDTALVHAAAGGLGLLLVQIAKLCGARVIGTTSTEAKAQMAKRVGADEVILYSTQDFEAEVKRLTDGKGVDVVYDSVGKTTFDKGLNCLRRRGTLVLCGQSSGPVPPFDPQTLNAKGSLFLTRPTLAHYTADRAEVLLRANDLFDWMRAGKLTVTIAKSFPLADVAAAHEFLESRAAIGKVMLIP